MIQIKYSCTCGKRILAPITHLHETKPCPKCQHPVKIPAFGEASFLLCLCACGESMEQYLSACPKCKLAIPPSLKPKNAFFRSLIKMKIRCACGKRLLVWANDTGKQETCPKCQKNFVIPAVSAVNVLHFICDCGNYLSVREEMCGQCHQPVRSEPEKSPAFSSNPLDKTATVEEEHARKEKTTFDASQGIDLTQRTEPQNQQAHPPKETLAQEPSPPLSLEEKNLEQKTQQETNLCVTEEEK